MPLSLRPSNFCCGLAEIGNFNYVGAQFPHYHRPDGAGSDKRVTSGTETTKAEIMDAVGKARGQGFGAVITTVGVDQEYLATLLPECGFTPLPAFLNPNHKGTKVEGWWLVLQEAV